MNGLLTGDDSAPDAHLCAALMSRSAQRAETRTRARVMPVWKN